MDEVLVLVYHTIQELDDWLALIDCYGREWEQHVQSKCSEFGGDLTNVDLGSPYSLTMRFPTAEQCVAFVLRYT